MVKFREYQKSLLSLVGYGLRWVAMLCSIHTFPYVRKLLVQ